MKRILTFIAIAIVGIYTFTGCRKYDYNPSMAATIDTTAFTSSGKINVSARVDTFTHNPQLVIITGVSDVYTPGTSFTPRIVLTAPNVIGSYSINAYDTTRGAVIYTIAHGSIGTVAVSGTINVLSIDGGKVKGNFDLTCADGTAVKSGQYIAIESYY